LILLTNDDGVDAPGIAAMKEQLSSLEEVVVAAPEGEMSGVSHSVTLDMPITVRWIDEHTAAVRGTPTDCVLLAVHGFMKKKPSIVVSGINLGPNLGNDVTYSGTVAAAMEAAILGFRAAAISLSTRKDPDFGPAARFGRRLVEFLKETDLPPGTFLNVNVPNVGEEKVKGTRLTRLGRRTYRDDVVELSDPGGEACYRIGGEPRSELEEGTDVEAVALGYISVTPLTLDLTDYRYLKFLSDRTCLEELDQ
jgi:5'-nucleotidase